MSKTLKIKKIFCWTIYNNIKNTPPKDIPTTGEIQEIVSGILPILKPHVEEYIGIFDKIAENNKDLAEEKVDKKAHKEKFDELNKQYVDYNKEHADEECALEFSDTAFKTLRSQFDRDNGGKTWVANLDEFVELMEAFNEAGK